MKTTNKKLIAFERQYVAFLRWEFAQNLKEDLTNFLDIQGEDLTEEEKETLQKSILCLSRKNKLLEDRFFEGL